MDEAIEPQWGEKSVWHRFCGLYVRKQCKDNNVSANIKIGGAFNGRIDQPNGRKDSGG
jgi:hypothetical protein